MISYVVDTNVLIRLQDVGQLQALATLTDCELLLTDTVWLEATKKPNVGAAAAKILTAIPHVKTHPFVPNAPETTHLSALRDRYPTSKYQDGELSVIALAAIHLHLVPVVFECRGHVAAGDELRRLVLTGHWFFSELHSKHSLPANVFAECVAILDSKNYPTPTWFLP